MSDGPLGRCVGRVSQCNPSHATTFESPQQDSLHSTLWHEALLTCLRTGVNRDEGVITGYRVDLELISVGSETTPEPRKLPINLLPGRVCSPALEPPAYFTAIHGSSRISQFVLTRFDVPGRVAAWTVGAADAFPEAWASLRRLLPRLHEQLPMSRLWFRFGRPPITNEAVGVSCRPGTRPTVTSRWKEGIR